MKKTKKRIIAAAAALLVLILLLLLAFAGGSAEQRWQRQYDLGQRYLAEMKYEQAITAFNAAIQIDPGRAEGYIGLAGVYEAQGDLDKALEVLDEGRENTDDETILEEREKIKRRKRVPVTADEVTWAEEPAYAYDDVEPIWADDFGEMTAGRYSYANGKIEMPDIYAAELNFPQYSYFPQYYRVANGGTHRLFYMPDRIDSGNLTTSAREYGADLQIWSTSGIIFWGDAYEMKIRGEVYKSDGTRELLPAPWDVLEATNDLCPKADIYWNIADEKPYIGCNITFEDYAYIPFSSVQLHKPYPICRAAIEQHSFFGFDYFAPVDDRYAFIDPAGNLITDFVYERTGTFSNGLAAACRDGKWGYIDEDGKEVTEFIYDGAWQIYFDDPNEREAYPCTCDTMVVSLNGEMGVLYRDGTVLLQYGEFEDLAPAWNDLLWAKKDGRWGLIDLRDAKQKAGIGDETIEQPGGTFAAAGPAYTVSDNILYQEGDSEIHYLQIDGISSDVAQSINSVLYARAQANLRELTDNLEADLPEGIPQTTLTAAYTVTQASDRYLSIFGNTYIFYAGGMHGYNVPTAYTFDLTTGRQLALQDYADVNKIADSLLQGRGFTDYTIHSSVDLALASTANLQNILEFAWISDRQDLVDYLAASDGRGNEGQVHGVSFLYGDKVCFTMPASHAEGDYYVIFMDGKGVS